jgi:hypothetical protein
MDENLWDGNRGVAWHGMASPAFERFASDTPWTLDVLL